LNNSENQNEIRKTNILPKIMNYDTESILMKQNGDDDSVDAEDDLFDNGTIGSNY